MGIPDDTRQAASDAAAARGHWISLHTSDAGVTGANETSGGGYGRQLTMWTPDGAGTNTAAQVVVPCQAGSYTEAGIFSAASGGVFVGSAPFAEGTVIVSGLGSGVRVVLSWSA